MSDRTWKGIALAAAVGAALAAARAAEAPDPESAAAEKALQEAKVGVDGPGLLQFFRDRTLSDEARRRLAAAIKLLGDDSYAVRERASEELVRAGRSAAPFLRAALDDSDLEVSRRARRCLDEVTANSESTLASAAARLLMARKPDGAVEALLDYAPFIDDEAVETAVLEALARGGLKGGKADPALLKALKAKEPLTRAAAAFAVGQAEAEQAKQVAALLSDADARVRFRAAAARLRAADKAAVPVLAALLADGPFPAACQAEDLLFRLGGDQSPTTALNVDAESRRKARAAWEAWWKEHETKLDLAKVNFDEAMQGLNLIVVCDGGKGGGRVWECRADGKVRWEVNDGLNCPADAQVLPGGRLLIAEYQGNQVVERDRDGKVLWSKKVTRFATSCQRLPNGNTFIATYGELLEVTPKGDTVYSHKSQPGWGEIYRAQKLRNGHILLVCGANKVIEVDAAGKEVRAVTVPGQVNPWGSVEPLPGGRYLVALYGAGKVVEIDGDGKVHWEVKVPSASSAQRLPNGHTLVSSMDASQVIEFDRDGKEVWKQSAGGRPFRVRRY